MKVALLAALILGQTGLPLGPERALDIEFSIPFQRIVLYPGSGELRMLSNQRLSDAAQQAFDQEFRPSTYFSAFAYAKGGGWGYVTTTNSLDSARAIAMGECMASNDNCRILAEIVPAGYRDLAPGDITLAPEVADLYRNPASVGATFNVAMAISEDGAYAMSWGYETLAESEARAMQDCRSNLNQDQPGVPDMPCALVPGVPQPE